MEKSGQLSLILAESNGYLQTTDAIRNGISCHTVLDYVQKNDLQKVAHGVYMSDDAWPDEYYLLAIRNKKIIFSGDSALYLHGLTDREPFYMTVTVPQGYNATHLVKQGIHVVHTKKEWYEMGKTEVKTNMGNTVFAYDRERTICDMIRNKNDIEIQTFQTAMKEYMKGRKDLHKLMEYARELRIESSVRLYTEVML